MRQVEPQHRFNSAIEGIPPRPLVHSCHKSGIVCTARDILNTGAPADAATAAKTEAGAVAKAGAGAAATKVEESGPTEGEEDLSRLRKVESKPCGKILVLEGWITNDRLSTKSSKVRFKELSF